MSSAASSLIVLASVFGGALAGSLLRRSLWQDHISPDSKDTVKLSMALVSTMSALVLGLLVSSAKAFYDTQSAELNQMSADIVAQGRQATLARGSSSESRG
jgi:fluoride ion exporter CrcB/FEX